MIKIQKNESKLNYIFSIALFFFLDLILLNTLAFISFDDYSKYIWIISIVVFFLLYEKIYLFRYDFWIDLKKLLKSFFLSFFIAMIIVYIFDFKQTYQLSEITLFFLLNIFLAPIFKRYSKKYFLSKEFFKLKVKVVANEPHKSILLREINENWYLGLKHSSSDYQIVLISSNKYSKDKLEKILSKYSTNIKDVFVIPYLDNLDLSHSNILDYSNIKLSAIHIENRLLNIKNIFIKYIFEKTLVICAFPFALILHFFIAYLIKKDSSGAVLFKQKRLGKDGKIFRVYKYRTMYENQNEILDEYLKNNPDELEYYKEYHKYKNDPRITKIGRFLRSSSLDEFPQFYNILRGDMNLIGPRPYMIEEKEDMGKINKNIILKVKPGLTGLWQVSGRNELTFDRRMELDKWYIQNWSLWMDFVIFLKTIKVVLLKIGAK